MSEAVAEISPGMQAANQAGNELIRTFENLIFATKNWTDVLVDALKALSSILLRAALGGLAGGDGQGLFSFLNGSLSSAAAASNGHQPAAEPDKLGLRQSAEGVGGNGCPSRRRGWSASVAASPYVVGEQGAQSCSSPARAAPSSPRMSSTPPAQRCPNSANPGRRQRRLRSERGLPWAPAPSIVKEKSLVREMAAQ